MATSVGWKDLKIRKKNRGTDGFDVLYNILGDRINFTTESLFEDRSFRLDDEEDDDDDDNDDDDEDELEEEEDEDDEEEKKKVNVKRNDGSVIEEVSSTSKVSSVKQKGFIERYNDVKFANFVDYNCTINLCATSSSVELIPYVVCLKTNDGGEIYVDLNFIFEFDLSVFFSNIIRFRGTEFREIKCFGTLQILEGDFQLWANFVHLILSKEEFPFDRIGVEGLLKILRICDEYNESFLKRIVIGRIRSIIKKKRSSSYNFFSMCDEEEEEEDMKSSSRFSMDEISLLFLETGHLWARLFYHINKFGLPEPSLDQIVKLFCGDNKSNNGVGKKRSEIIEKSVLESCKVQILSNNTNNRDPGIKFVLLPVNVSSARERDEKEKGGVGKKKKRTKF